MVYQFNRNINVFDSKQIHNPCSQILRIILANALYILVGFFTCLLLTFSFCAYYVGHLNSVGTHIKNKQPAAIELYSLIKIFCIIDTYKERQNGVAVHAKRTWAQQCNNYLFISNDMHEELEPAVFNENRDKWILMRDKLEYIYKYHYHEGDWFLHANDDNFVIIENLRYLLRKYKTEEPLFLGCKLRNAENQIYMHGAAPFVLSREALRRFVVQALPNATLCQSEQGANADVELAKCLHNVDVVAGNSLDEQGKHTILPFEAGVHLMHDLNSSELKWFIKESYYPYDNQSVSKHAISFHVKYMPNIYNLNYFVRRVKIFGTKRQNISLD